ncbi:unnamed protein product [Ectocarpus sp. 6 AP-2014]
MGREFQADQQRFGCLFLWSCGSRVRTPITLVVGCSSDRTRSSCHRMPVLHILTSKARMAKGARRAKGVGGMGAWCSACAIRGTNWTGRAAPRVPLLEVFALLLYGRDGSGCRCLAGSICFLPFPT